MRRFSKIAFAFAATTALVAAAPVAEGGRKFTVELTGAAELAGGATMADMDASGTVHVYVNPGQRRVCWEFENLVNVDPQISNAHIHAGEADETGSPVVHFFNGTANVDLEHCTATNLDRQLLVDIIQNPENYYVNLHTTVYPGGAIRGQLSK